MKFQSTALINNLWNAIATLLFVILFLKYGVVYHDKAPYLYLQLIASLRMKCDVV